MATRDDLEAALRASPDRDTLSVYADLLQTAGDPRGALIALELNHGPERYELLLKWLAAELRGSSGLHAMYHWDTWMNEPLGDFMRGILAIAHADEVQSLLDVVSSRPRPWLTRAHISCDQAPNERIALDEALVRATPNLVELEVHGRVDLTRFAHPSVKKLRRIMGMEGAAAGELIPPVELPSVTHLELGLDPWPVNVSEQLVTCEHLPALETLDIGEMEPYTPSAGFCSFPTFRWLFTLAAARRLTKLVVPSVRTAEAANVLAELLGASPRLTITIARAYSRCDFARDLSPRITVPEPYPWWPPDGGRKGDKEFVVDAAPKPIEILGWYLAFDLQRHWSGFDANARALWRELVAMFDACERGPVTVPRAKLVAGYALFTNNKRLDIYTHGKLAAASGETVVVRAKR